MRPVGRIYLERGEPVVVRIQWGLKSRGESYGGPRNVLIERESGELVVRPFRGLRPTYTVSRGNTIPRFASIGELDEEALALYDGLKSRPCGHCGQQLDGAWWEAHDPCIANLPGVRYACCGHGVAPEVDGRFAVDASGRVRAGPARTVPVDQCYVVFDDGIRLGGNAAREAMRMLGGNPPDAPAGARPSLVEGWEAVADIG